MSNARFSILQARAVRDNRITDSQFRTLAALGMYADEDGWCFPKLSTLGEDRGKSKQAVGRDVIALRKLGYLEIRAQYDKNGGRRNSLYRLKFDLPPRQHDVDTPSTSYVDTPSTSEVDAINDPENDPKERVTRISNLGIANKIASGMPITEADLEVDSTEKVIVTLEESLHVNIDRSLRNQQVAKRILRDGRPLEQWISWCKSDEWRLSHLYLYRNLERIWGEWPQAFPKDTPPARTGNEFYA